MTGCIVTDGLGAEGVYVDDGSSAAISCTDIFGNPNGDWIGPIADQLGQNGNISCDPLYCDPAANDFTLAENSPCVTDPDCGVMGAHPIGCYHPVAVGDGPLSGGRVVLAQNFPNPFNPATTIAYHLPHPARCALRVFDAAGRTVAVLGDGGTQAAGRHTVVWTGRDRSGRPLPSGIYFYRLDLDGVGHTKRMTLMR
jgi:hypothetical protein